MSVSGIRLATASLPLANAQMQVTALFHTVKEGGRLWGIRPAQRDIDGCDYIAFLAKDWYVELIVAKENKNANTKDL